MEQAPHIVVLGSASVDFTTYAPNLPGPGETIHGNKFATSYGGKGANQCVAATILGGKTYFIGRLGHDKWGSEYHDYLTNLGVNTKHTKITKNTSTGIAQIMVSATGENSIVIVAGANKLLSIDDVKEASDIIQTTSVLVCQLETPVAATLEAFKLCQGITILNAAPAIPDLGELVQCCSILCVNESEAALISGLPVDSIKSAVLALKKLIQCGFKTVIITLGKDGAIYSKYDDNKVIQVHCEQVKAIDTTGAGDAFTGALSLFLAIHPTKPLHQQVAAACRVASDSVTREGTQNSYKKLDGLFSQEYAYHEITYKNGI